MAAVIYLMRGDVTDDFSPGGVLTGAIPGFRPRAAQQQMAEAVAEVIRQGGELVAEAGTGTGKTYAYLVPALRANKKVIISTGSRALQDQLYTRDLPAIVNALQFKGKTAILKGRSNYLCLERMDQQNMSGGDLPVQALTDLVSVRGWSSQTVDGDISQCGSVAEDSSLWPLVTSTNDNCLGSDCPRYGDCFVVKARQRAMDADVVVVNHHLFLADLVVKESGFAELIPDADVMIFDEAHQLPDIASQYFGQQVSSRQLQDLARDIMIAYRTEVRDMQQLQKSADRLSQASQDFRLILGDPGFRGNLRELLQRNDVSRMLVLLDDALELCYDVIKLSFGRSALLDAAFERAAQYRTRLKRISQTREAGFSYWYECHARHFTLALTPLSVAERFREVMDARKSSWVFTSATLSVNGKMDHFAHRLGVNAARQLILSSPFDYQRQALLCVPRNLPENQRPGAARQLATLLAPLIEVNRGRCFFLCTSYQMMRELAAEFRERLTLPVLLQGETSKGQILQQFIEAGNALLVATSSFWEGVDVRGDALSLVIIDKLPFTSPEDPLLKARMEDARHRGLDPFDEVQLPDAVITLKQGAGRLIRDVTDRGVLVICDQRLVSRPYGGLFLNSLPDAPRTRDLQVAETFIRQGKVLVENGDN